MSNIKKPAQKSGGMFQSLYNLFSPKISQLSVEESKKDKLAGKTINYLNKLTQQQEQFAKKNRDSNS